VPADPEAAAALEHIARTLQTLGAEISDVRLPTLSEFAAFNRVILQSEAWAMHGLLVEFPRGKSVSPPTASKCSMTPPLPGCSPPS
jgi:Asp-tRNA(Asn)/Glu-tRNA(Gln) amidotransferase A subunit family amidase